MKFLFITQYFPPDIGATQVRLASTIRELIRVGHDAEVVTAVPHYPEGRISPEYRGTFYRKETWEGITVHRLWVYPASGAGLRRILNYLSFTFSSLFGIFLARRPDCVFVESPPLFLTFPAYLASRWWKARLIFNVADLWPDSVHSVGAISDGWLLRAARRFEKWSYRRATFINALTDRMCETLLKEKGIAPEKLLFLPNGVDTDLFKPMPPDESLLQELRLQGKRIALYIGSHGYVAGLETVLNAAKSLQKDSDIHFLFVGAGSDKPRLLSLAEQLDLGNVSFLPAVPLDQVPRSLSIASCCLITARNYAICDGARPAKTFVIMASGKPIVLSHNGEAGDLLRRSGAGVVIPAEDSNALAEAVRSLLNDPARSELLGRKGRQYAEENFRWSDLVRDWLRQMEARSSTLRPRERPVVEAANIEVRSSDPL